MGSAFEGKKEVEKIPPPITLEDPDLPEHLERLNITGLDLEAVEVKTVH